MTSDPPRQQLAAEAEPVLIGLGFAVGAKPSAKGRPNTAWTIRRGKRRYLVAVRSIVPFRRRDLHGAVADAFLRLAQAQAGSKAELLVVLQFEQLSAKISDEIAAYAETFAIGLNWIAYDRSGKASWLVDGNRGEQHLVLQSAAPPSSGWAKKPAGRNIFTPQGQQLLKTLVLPGLEPKFGRGPAIRPDNVNALARAADVSQPYTSLFVKALEHEGFIARKGRTFTLQDVGRLLRDWSAAVRLAHDPRRAMKSLYPSADPAAERRKLISKLTTLAVSPGDGDKERRVMRYAVGSYYACNLLGLGRTNLDDLLLFVAGSIDPLASELNLVSADGAGTVEFAVPRAINSVFTHCVQVDGVWVADVIQCYLEIQSSPVRGAEQAEYIFEKLLHPHFRRQGWL